MDEKLLAELRALAVQLSTEADPWYKDAWETGYDAGTGEAGRKLTALLDAAGIPSGRSSAPAAEGH